MRLSLRTHYLLACFTCVAALSLQTARVSKGATEAAGIAAGAPLPRIELKLRNSTGNRVFVEVGTGRERVFHGTNVVVKGPPWLPRRDVFDPMTSLVDQDFEYMQAAGLNLIRFGVAWAAGEPERGQYNSEYFDELRAIVEDAARYGIYVLFDMHQDVLSEKFCGQGLPSWAVPDPPEAGMHFPVPLQWMPADRGQDGFPTRQKCAQIFQHNSIQRNYWDVSHMAFATQYAFENLYTNADGLTDAWGAFLAKIASTMQGLTNVLGIELINEPFVGNGITHPELFLPGIADSRRLQDAYDTVAGHIRKVDPDMLIFFEGITYDNTHSVGFDHAPAGKEWADKSVLAYHYYRPPQPTTGPFTTYMEARRNDARRLGTGLLMTESCCGDLEFAFPGLAAAGQSWVHWEWKDWCRENSTTVEWASQNAEYGACKTGFGAGPFSAKWGGEAGSTSVQRKGSTSPETGAMKKLAQPYASAVSGSLVGTTWHAGSGTFELTYWPDTEISEPTVIFLNTKLTFSTRLTITVSPEEIVQVEENLEAREVKLWFDKSKNATDEPIVVNIKRNKGGNKWWPFLEEQQGNNNVTLRSVRAA